jgi:hypothetical protein
MIDPPGGWRYGFPRALVLNSGETVREWLIRYGYPEDELEFAMKYLRSWTQELPEKDQSK